MEAQCIKEWLDNDPVANYQDYLGNTKVGLTYFTRNRQGVIKESFTASEASLLMMHKKPRTVINGRVPSSICWDELSNHFGMTEDQLHSRIKQVCVMQDRLRSIRAHR